MSSSGFGPLDELARRPDAPVLVIHRRDPADARGDLATAKARYAAMVVIPLDGPTANAKALKGRDVVLWPHGASRLAQRDLAAFTAELSREAKRLRLIAPENPIHWKGPADLNGADPVEWARAHCLDVPRLETPLELPEPAIRPERFKADDERPAYVQDYVPSMIEAPRPEPVDLFEKPAIPALDRAMLAPSLATFVFDQSEIIGCDPCILAIASLVACAAVTSDGHRLQPKQYEYGWKESARLWGAFVGDPSVKKTPPLNRAIAHLRKIDADFAKDGEAAFRSFKIAHKVYEAQEKRYVADSAKGRAGDLPEPPERPPQRRVVVQDATIEAVADVLADNPEGVLVLFDELAGFFGSMDAYRAQGGKDRSFWLEAYNGGPRRVDRISREARNVPNLSVCILGGIQPAAIRERARDMVEDGLLQRFMIVVASGGHSLGVDRRADTEATALYRGILDALVRDQSWDAEKPITFEPAARAALLRVEAKLDELARAEHLPLRMRYQLGKWSGLFCRLSLTYHAIECAACGLPIGGEIAADLAERVEAFMFKFLLPHLQHFYEAILGDSTGELELTQRVAKWILAAAPDRFTSWHVSKGVTAWRGSAWNTRRNVLDRLENCGWITKADGRTSAWDVNPAVRELFAEIADQERSRRADIRERIASNINDS